MGVSKESKGYKLFNPITKKVIVSRDVIFEEEKKWDRDKSFQEQILMDLNWEDDCCEKGVDVDSDNTENEDYCGHKKAANDVTNGAGGILKVNEGNNADGANDNMQMETLVQMVL